MRTFILAVALLVSFKVVGQTSETPQLPKKLKRISTPQMYVNDDDNTVLLKMDFNGAVPKSKLELIKPESIATISLLYSRYKLSETFDQLTLNAQRMDKLYAAMPALRMNKDIQWYWVEQTGCDNPESCKDVFHGFVITLKSVAAIEKRATEIDLLDYYTSMYEGSTDSKKMDSIIAVRKLNLQKICDTAVIRKLNKENRIGVIKGWGDDDKSKLARHLRKELQDSGVYQLQLTMDKRGHLEFASFNSIPDKVHKIVRLLNEELVIAPSRYNGTKINSRVNITIDITGKKGIKVFSQLEPILPNGEEFQLDRFLYTEKRSIVCEYVDTSVKEEMRYYKTTPDIIFKVFDRNKQWKNCLIATDVTGSMYPYLAQFKLWHKYHLAANSGNHDFVFFNDGNNSPDFLKITGKVGGIYYINTSDYYDLDSTMLLSMHRGGGGDGPENNIEAVIEGLKKNPDCKEVIMIADNWATPRDLSLLHQVKVPIRLILCGTHYNGINTAYLDMVRKNNGSIHTIEKDLYDLSKMLEGQHITIDDQTFVLRAGQFVKEADSGSTVAR